MTNILRPQVLDGIRGQALKVAEYCEKSAGKAIDAYVSRLNIILQTTLT